MTKKELIKTVWAKEFKKDSPISYETGINLAMSPELIVSVYKTNETGEYVWCISVCEPADHGCFWMDAKKTKKEAIELCKLMGWKRTKSGSKCGR